MLLKPLSFSQKKWKTPRIAKKTRLIFMMTSALFSTAWAEEMKPPHPINTATLIERVLEKTVHNTHYQIIGACLWGKASPPGVETAPAIEQYLPDFVVTVSNQAGSNPWQEIGLAYENQAARRGYQLAFQKVTGMWFDVADGSSQMNPQHLNEQRTRIVSVIGSPASLYRLPEITHKPETRFGKPYYSSLADAVSDRTEAGEIAYMATHPTLLMGHDIGSFTNNWGQEVPRLMRITQPSRFRASVVAAMHAADIVTNKKSLHVARFTQNACGPNCVVANVIYDPKQERVLWQEVYPNNRMIKPGDPTDFGVADDKAGHGNYVFVIWRKYRGCIKQNGQLIQGSPVVGKPHKR
jgi:integrating conjugative element protein (TIGR03756 family)